MDRATDLAAWPHGDTSRFIRCKPHDWHVQEMGRGPLVLLLHGAGASTHTWRDILPRLAIDWRVIALDLPGQGFTRAGTLCRCGLEPMSEDIATLCKSEDWAPVAIVGHSAGAAIALDLAMRFDPVPAVVGINAALGRFKGVASWLFPLLARLLSLNPLTAAIFTLGKDHRARARRLIEGTGSVLDEAGIRLYATLIGDRRHVDATLQMMTQWDVEGLRRRLPRITARTLLITGSNDRAVPPHTSEDAASHLPNAELMKIDWLGHLAHEENPATIAENIGQFLRSLPAVGNVDDVAR